MCIFHNWSKWEYYTEAGTRNKICLRNDGLVDRPYEYSEKRRKKTCKKCGEQQDEFIEGN